MFFKAYIILVIAAFPVTVQAQTVILGTPKLKLQWHKAKNDIKLQTLQLKHGNKWILINKPIGEYLLLYSALPIDTVSIPQFDKTHKRISFPGDDFKFMESKWRELTRPVHMNTAGEAIYFYPSSVIKKKDGSLMFTKGCAEAQITATWCTDPRFPSDILVNIKIKANKDGYYSIATPTINIQDKNELKWATLPGYFQGNFLQQDLIKTYIYGQGIPEKPLVVRERTATTLAPIITGKDGISMAVIASPGTARNPWNNNANTHIEWGLGLSLMNRRAQLTPTLYHPVLGENHSWLKQGESISFSFRYTIMDNNWYEVYRHAVNDIYKISDFLKLKRASFSLTSRILAMHKYLINDTLSMWDTLTYRGLKIGAQHYLSRVLGSNKDAMKNSDYGAMWMLANVMRDSVLKNTRLPYARNFKFAQQVHHNDFFNGALAGQYFLKNSKRFTEEWGPYTEPIGITYYLLCDMGNILLFNPDDLQLRKEFEVAADKLKSWMKPDGSFPIAFDLKSKQEEFNDLTDFRPTFYGLVVAYKILHQKKYLDAAQRAANWYIKNAIEKGQFLGVCGDFRFMPDFAAAQAVQALLDLYDITHKQQYLNAAVNGAHIYLTNIYTHPIPTNDIKNVNGKQRADWEISQVGLNFEHGGTMGSANRRGPILLSSHAGMFVRLYQLTGDVLFLNMARAAALGRDAFVNPQTHIASYYWDRMNEGAGPYPHHAWWQVGWITDYLLSELSMRSKNAINFPRGFCTPKVGPHQPYGFASGWVYGQPADLLLLDGLVKINNPYADYYCAVNQHTHKLYIMILNNNGKVLRTTFNVNLTRLSAIATNSHFSQTVFITADGQRKKAGLNNNQPIQLKPYGILTVEITF